jgi:large subunit ribosomal protein L22
MQVSAKLKNLRVSSRKTRLVADTIRGKKINDARIQLQFSTKKTSRDILTLLNSAVSNAKNNFSLDENNLFVYSIFVNDGPILKRWRPRAMGRAAAIQKRTCTINIILDELNAGKEAVKEEKATTKAEKVVKSKEKVSEEDK